MTKKTKRTFSAGETFEHWDGGTIHVLGAGPMGCTVVHISADGKAGKVSQVSHSWLRNYLSH